MSRWAIEEAFPYIKHLFETTEAGKSIANVPKHLAEQNIFPEKMVVPPNLRPGPRR